MRYWGLVAIFFSCLVLKAGMADVTDDAVIAESDAAPAAEVAVKPREESIPEEAIKIPYKQRKKETHLAQTSSRQQLVLAEKSYSESAAFPVALFPMIGATMYAGNWNNHIGNAFSLGLGLEVPITDLLSAEAQGGYGNFNITHSGVMKDFNQYWLGAGMRVYANRTRVFRPYIALGMDAVNYENMVTFNDKNNRWVGVSQLAVGSDFGFMENVSFGLRGSWHKPILNRPVTNDVGGFSHPAYADNAAINTDFFRVMGTVKVDL